MKIYDKQKNSGTSENNRFGFFPFVVLAVAAVMILSAAIALYCFNRNTEYTSENITDEYKSVISFSTPAKELSVPEIVKKVKPSVVGISSKFSETSIGTGTGIILSSDGYVVTNAHVVRSSADGNHITAQQVTVVLSDKSEYIAEIIGFDPRTDLAVLKINAGNKKLVSAEFGDSTKLAEGELAVAIGNPLGFELYGSVTCGIISALNRSITIDEYEMTLIQTDAAINPGNSGGPLLNSCGQVVGINSSKIISDYAEGLGFAIPITSAKTVIDDLIRNGYVTGRARIGISGEDVGKSNAKYYDLPEGVYVRYIEKNSAAEASGIEVGDIIVAADGQTVTTMRELNKIKEAFSSGDNLSLTVFRDGESINITVLLGEEKAMR
ncbi:MAG: trypsin-like peptidase domain-containing protein [Oscillospiraceae bacterium]|nr:trypsin-like peptidase domain-containing protein [Oscillospiraceae bacterium]